MESSISSPVQQPGSELKAKWKALVDATESNWDRNFWRVMADRTPLPNQDAYYQSHLILDNFANHIRILIEGLERAGLDLSHWQGEIKKIKNELNKRDAMSDMFNADWHS